MRSGAAPLLALALAALLSVAPPARAWNDTGHMLTTLITYAHLPQAQREAAARLLRAHPRFEEDFLEHMPRQLRGADAAAQDRWVFAFAATWPDLARHFEHVGPAPRREALIERYHRPRWHYINLPHFLDGAERRAVGEVPANLSFDWTAAGQEEAFNLVQALTYVSPRLHGGAAGAVAEGERAVLLCWLLHLIGDLHQPLHSTALFTSMAFPEGDRGGNDLLIEGHGNLHALWDDALGSERRWGALLARLQGLLERAPPADIAPAPKALAETLAQRYGRWAREGHWLAGEHVYVPQVLEGVAAANTRPRRNLPVELPDGYRSAMRSLAEDRAVVAGRRGARLLARLLEAGR